MFISKRGILFRISNPILKFCNLLINTNAKFVSVPLSIKLAYTLKLMWEIHFKPSTKPK